MRLWTGLILLLVGGCAVDQEGYCEGREQTCADMIEELQARVAALEAAELDTRITAIEDGTYVPENTATTDEVATALAAAKAHADEGDVATLAAAQEHADEGDLGITTVLGTDYATLAWVELQDFATEDWVEAKGYSTESWVGGQGLRLRELGGGQGQRHGVLCR